LHLSRLPSDSAPSTIRYVPIEAVVLTDAELDHSLGLVLLREARQFPLYTTTAVRAILDDDSRILAVTRAFAEVRWTELELDRSVDLRHRDGAPSGLAVETFQVPAGPPRFAPDANIGHTVGLIVRESPSGRVCAFVPGCGEVTSTIRE